MTLAKWIHDRRLKRKDVAAYLGMSPEHISRVCCGKANLSKQAWRLLDLYDHEYQSVA